MAETKEQLIIEAKFDDSGLKQQAEQASNSVRQSLSKIDPVTKNLQGSLNGVKTSLGDLSKSKSFKDITDNAKKASDNFGLVKSTLQQIDPVTKNINQSLISIGSSSTHAKNNFHGIQFDLQSSQLKLKAFQTLVEQINQGKIAKNYENIAKTSSTDWERNSLFELAKQARMQEQKYRDSYQQIVKQIGYYTESEKQAINNLKQHGIALDNYIQKSLKASQATDRKTQSLQKLNQEKQVKEYDNKSDGSKNIYLDEQAQKTIKVTNATNAQTQAVNKLGQAYQNAKTAMRGFGYLALVSQIGNRVGAVVERNAKTETGKAVGAGIGGAASGLMGGAMIGSMIAPVIGTGIGAAVGALTGAFFSCREAVLNFRASLQEKASVIWDTITKRDQDKKDIALLKDYGKLSEEEIQKKIDSQLKVITIKEEDLKKSYFNEDGKLATESPISLEFATNLNKEIERAYKEVEMLKSVLAQKIQARNIEEEKKNQIQMGIQGRQTQYDEEIYNRETEEELKKFSESLKGTSINLDHYKDQIKLALDNLRNSTQTEEDFEQARKELAIADRKLAIAENRKAEQQNQLERNSQEKATNRLRELNDTKNMLSGKISSLNNFNGFITDSWARIGASRGYQGVNQGIGNKITQIIQVLNKQLKVTERGIDKLSNQTAIAG